MRNPFSHPWQTESSCCFPYGVLWHGNSFSPTQITLEKGFAAWIPPIVWAVWIFTAGDWVYSIGCSEVSLSGLFPLDLPFPVMTFKNVPRHCQTSFRGKKIITVKNLYLGSLDMTSYCWLTSFGLCTKPKKLIEVVSPSPEVFLPWFITQKGVMLGFSWLVFFKFKFNLLSRNREMVGSIPDFR